MSKKLRHCVLCNSYSNCYHRIDLRHADEEVTICCDCILTIQQFEGYDITDEKTEEIIYTEFDFIELNNNE